MFKVFFPGGDQLIPPPCFEEVGNDFNLCNGIPDENEQTSIRLLSRVFCMVNLQEVDKINLNGKNLSKMQNIGQIDFDIAQFCTLMERFKYTWRTAF